MFTTIAFAERKREFRFLILLINAWHFSEVPYLLGRYTIVFLISKPDVRELASLDFLTLDFALFEDTHA